MIMYNCLLFLTLPIAYVIFIKIYYAGSLLFSKTGVFNRGSATPRGSVEVLQGVHQMISSEAFFSLFQKCKTSKRLQKHKQNVKIAFYSLKIIHRLPMSLHAIISRSEEHTLNSSHTCISHAALCL